MPRPVLAVLGGSFNPPHIGHAMIPTYLRLRGLASRVLVAPCWSHPFAKSMAPFAERLAWTRAAFAVHGEEVEVSDLEATLAARRGGGPSYTFDLLEAIAAERPEWDVRLVIGTDIVARGELDRWHRIDELRRRFPPLIVPRAGYAPPEACALPEVSSTAIRGWLADPAAPESRAGLEASVPAATLALLRRQSPGTVWLIGHGHVASHAEPWLRARGWATRTIGARALVAGEAVLPQLEDEEPRPAAIWMLCGDPKIPAVAAALGEALARREDLTGAPILHGAGALPARSARALGALVAAGHPVGTLHPICSLRREKLGGSLLGAATFGVEGDRAAKDAALALLGDQPWLDLDGLDDRGRLAYHGACALAANHLAVPFADACAVLIAQGHPREVVEEGIATLLRSSLANLLALGIPEGVTGPVSRGDQAAIDGHLAALEGTSAGAIYRALSERLAAILAAARTCGAT
jgi:nicotinate-nucleotide adenylyltransferase